MLWLTQYHCYIVLQVKRWNFQSHIQAFPSLGIYNNWVWGTDGEHYEIYETVWWNTWHISSIGLRTSKWHTLDHVVMISLMFEMCMLSTKGQDEGSHKFFKEHYRRTSKRKESALKETFILLNYDAMLSNPAGQKKENLSNKSCPSRCCSNRRRISSETWGEDHVNGAGRRSEKSKRNMLEAKMQQEVCLAAGKLVGWEQHAHYGSLVERASDSM